MAEKTTWKTIAIIFIILFVLGSSFIIYSLVDYNKEIDKANTCWYDICSEYPEAYYELDVCTCYEYDMFGEFIEAKTKYMK